MSYEPTATVPAARSQGLAGKRVWMRYRGHSAARTVEMAASMVVPTAVATGLAALGVLGAGAALAFQHAVMVPAMLAAMLWR